MKVNFKLNGIAVNGKINIENLQTSLLSGSPYALAICLSNDVESRNIAVDDMHGNCDPSKGEIYCEVSSRVNFGEERKFFDKISLGGVVEAECRSLTFIGNMRLTVRLELVPDCHGICFVLGENPFLSALLGMSPLGRLGCYGGDFLFGNYPAFRDSDDKEGTSSLIAELHPIEHGLGIDFNLKTPKPELVIENDGIPVMRSLAKQITTEERTVSGEFSPSGAFYLADDISELLSVAVDNALCDDALAIPLLRGVKRAYELDSESGIVLGEPSHNFAAVKQGDRLTIYEATDGLPKIVRTLECKGCFALCTDGTTAVCDDGISVCFGDGTKKKFENFKGEKIVMVKQGELYHIAVKRGNSLIRFVTDIAGNYRLISIANGIDEVFRASEDAIGFTDGDTVTVSSIDGYREYKLPPETTQSSELFSDCGYYSTGNTVGNCRFGTSFDINADFVGCDGLACADGNLVSLADIPVSLCEGISSAALLGNYVIAAEKDALAVYYGFFEGAFIVSEKSAGKSFTMRYTAGTAPFEQGASGSIGLIFESGGEEI